MQVTITSALLESVKLPHGSFSLRAMSMFSIPEQRQLGWRQRIIGKMVHVDVEELRDELLHVAQELRSKADFVDDMLSKLCYEEFEKAIDSEFE